MPAADCSSRQWLLANEAMRPHVIPDSYRVHIPPNGRRLPSDHRLVTAAFDLSEGGPTTATAHQ